MTEHWWARAQRERMNAQYAGFQPLLDAAQAGQVLNIGGTNFMIHKLQVTGSVGDVIMADLTLLYVGKDMEAMG